MTFGRHDISVLWGVFVVYAFVFTAGRSTLATPGYDDDLGGPPGIRLLLNR